MNMIGFINSQLGALLNIEYHRWLTEDVGTTG